MPVPEYIGVVPDEPGTCRSDGYAAPTAQQGDLEQIPHHLNAILGHMVQEEHVM